MMDDENLARSVRNESANSAFSYPVCISVTRETPKSQSRHTFRCEVGSRHVRARPTRSSAARERAFSVLQRFPKYSALSGKHIRRIDLLRRIYGMVYAGNTVIHQYGRQSGRPPDKTLTRRTREEGRSADDSIHGNSSARILIPPRVTYYYWGKIIYDNLY